jgi:hypothetical protein
VSHRQQYYTFAEVMIPRLHASSKGFMMIGDDEAERRSKNSFSELPTT